MSGSVTQGHQGKWTDQPCVSFGEECTRNKTRSLLGPNMQRDTELTSLNQNQTHPNLPDVPYKSMGRYFKSEILVHVVTPAFL